MATRVSQLSALSGRIVECATRGYGTKHAHLSFQTAGLVGATTSLNFLMAQCLVVGISPRSIPHASESEKWFLSLSFVLRLGQRPLRASYFASASEHFWCELLTIKIVEKKGPGTRSILRPPSLLLRSRLMLSRDSASTQKALAAIPA